eukprot:CAMPEP_0117666454 /NCGR_PEP_ID=MMETSP0804-20121206/10386_1 /TAXON_ID=1074897 /ORGANISM="Tetraselmis astigmatica, Strain CCMP880" /LENGTH=82 /DNA_ID=CAMNT_0005474003 /DNA_START=387 /DNA_END=632 /DNA_ORIENTATION=-
MTSWPAVCHMGSARLVSGFPSRIPAPHLMTEELKVPLNSVALDGVHIAYHVLVVPGIHHMLCSFVVCVRNRVDGGSVIDVVG